jgi:hypothetical protein
VNNHIQSVIGCHKGGHVKNPLKKIAHNNNVRTRNMNQLWHTIGARVLQQIHRELLCPVVFTVGCSSSTFKVLVLPGLNVKASYVHTLRTDLVSFGI